jgi:hypothetical protein
MNLFAKSLGKLKSAHVYVICIIDFDHMATKITQLKALSSAFWKTQNKSFQRHWKMT